jgi:uncharacterized protein (TIGR03382 family)
MCALHLTYADPTALLGITMLGEGTGTTLATAGGLIAFAVLGLGAALLLARRHPDAEHAPGRLGQVAPTPGARSSSRTG